MHSHRSHEITPNSWEADVLKLRGLEMLLVLFYLEDLRRLILSSTKPMKRERQALAEPKPPREQLDEARGILVSQGVLSQSESDELLSLMDYRNVVGDGLHQFNGVGAYSALIAFKPGDSTLHGNTLTQRMEAIRKKVRLGMRRCLFPPTSLDIQQFDAVERIFHTEIAQLDTLVTQGLRCSIQAGTKTNKGTIRTLQSGPT